MPTAPPQPGDLVEVRRRQFLVQDVKRAALGTSQETHRQHVVELSSVDEGAIGEELSVVWEIEPGARVVPGAKELPGPEGFDDPLRFDAFLDAVRWGTVDAGDPRVLQSPFRTGIQIKDYQLDPVVRALRMPRVNLLIADDVGLGKTIESGLVVEEMMLRHRVRNVLVITPASVQIQWQEQMRDKFGLEFRIVDSELLRQLRRRRGVRVNPWTHYPLLITSIDFLKRQENLRRLREVLPRTPTYPRPFDLMIVDEAHNVAPTRAGKYSSDSDRTKAIRELIPHFEHKLFLTATPHNGYSESWASFLALLDDQRFAPSIPPDPKQVEQVVIRRLKQDLTDEHGGPRFPTRQVAHLEVDYPDREREVHAWLQSYSRGRKTAAASADDSSAETAATFIGQLLKKRLFSSPAAFAATLEKHAQTLRGFEAARRKPRVAPKLLRLAIERAEADHGNDDDWDQEVDAAVDVATATMPTLGEHERGLLQRLRDWATQASSRPDAKASKLLHWLESTCRPGREWNDERVIVFTEYRATQKYLHSLLVQHGLGDPARLALLHGGVGSDEREKVKAAFQASPSHSSVRILLATDAASEGIDLQNHCHRVVHYEIPWNPNRMEQRNGRVDRYGQRYPPEIYHFAPRGFEQRLAADQDAEPGDLEGDLEFLARAAKKVDTQRQDLGTVGEVLSRQIHRAMSGMSSELDVPSEQQARLERARRDLAFERGQRDRMQELHRGLAESRKELRVDPDNVRAVVEVALAMSGQPGLRQGRLEGIWPEGERAGESCPVFELPELTPPWDRCMRGLAHPHTKKVRPVTFDHDLVEGRDDVVLVHLEHALVAMAQRILRAEVWRVAGQRHLHRVTARTTNGDLDGDMALLAHARLVVVGRDNSVLHEEVLTAGGVIKDGHFSRFQTVGQARELGDTAGAAPTDPARLEAAQAVWPRVVESLTKAVEARMTERTRTLHSRMAARGEEDVKRMTEVLDELRRNIESQLRVEQSGPVQQELFSMSADEKDGYERNLAQLGRRLAEIPREIEEESRRLRAKYSDPRPLLFPLSVTWLFPEEAI